MAGTERLRGCPGFRLIIEFGDGKGRGLLAPLRSEARK